MAVLSRDVEPDVDRREQLRGSEAVRKLSRALQLAEGFALYILVCDRASDGAVMLDLVCETMEARGAHIRWVHLTPSQGTDDIGASLERGLLAPLVETRTQAPISGEVFVLHAETVRATDRATWKELFNRMNRARNLIVPRVGVPLVLLLGRGEYALFADSAPDFWSLRSEVWRGIPAPESEVDLPLFLDPQEFALRLQESAARACRVQVAGHTRGTGFLVAPDLMLTEYHGVRDLIEGRRSAADASMRFEGDGAMIEAHLSSEWLVDSAPPSAADLNDGEGEHPADALDYALLRLAVAAGNTRRANGSVRGWFDLRRVAPRPGSSLTILQHAGGGPLTFTTNPASVVGYNDNRTRVRHRTDTLVGSAGGPCLDAQWNLVAMHHAGYPRVGFNQAVPMAAIYDLLRARGKLDEIERHARVAPLTRRLE